MYLQQAMHRASASFRADSSLTLPAIGSSIAVRVIFARQAQQAAWPHPRLIRALAADLHTTQEAAGEAMEAGLAL